MADHRSVEPHRSKNCSGSSEAEFSRSTGGVCPANPRLPLGGEVERSRNARPGPAELLPPGRSRTGATGTPRWEGSAAPREPTAGLGSPGGATIRGAGGGPRQRGVPVAWGSARPGPARWGGSEEAPRAPAEEAESREAAGAPAALLGLGSRLARSPRLRRELQGPPRRCYRALQQGRWGRGRASRWKN